MYTKVNDYLGREKEHDNPGFNRLNNNFPGILWKWKFSVSNLK